MKTIVKDDFHGANASLANHTAQVGGNWVDTVPGLGIAGNVAAIIDGDEGTSTAGISSKIPIGEITIDLTGCGQESNIGIKGENDSNGDYVSFLLWAKGQTEITSHRDGGADVLVNHLLGNIPAGNHTLRLATGPSRVVASLDGQVLCELPRYPLTSVPFSKLSLVMFKDGDPSPIARQAIVIG